jgi:hypothetical protein
MMQQVSLKSKTDWKSQTQRFPLLPEPETDIHVKIIATWVIEIAAMTTGSLLYLVSGPCPQSRGKRL